MPGYIIDNKLDKQGNRTIHTTECTHLKKIKDYTILGWHSMSEAAYNKAKERYTAINGCQSCCRISHTVYESE